MPRVADARKANDPPTLFSPKNFVGLGILSTDKYWGDGLKGEDKLDHQYFINTVGQFTSDG